MREVSPTRALVVAFSCVVLVFVAATGYAEFRGFAISQLAQDIAERDAPAIEHLTAARAELRRLRRAPPDDVRDAWERTREEIDAYEALPLVAGEHELREQLRVTSSLVADDVSAGAAAGGVMRSHVADLLSIGRDLLELHTARTRTAALAIGRIRAAAMWIAFALDAVAVLVTILTAYLLLDVLRRQAHLREEQHRLVEEKAAELEQFSARLAHDIAGPISAAAMSIEIASTMPMGEQRASLLARARRALVRVSDLSRALLEFAKSGAQPDPSARCDARQAIEGALDELAERAKNLGVALSTQSDARRLVACAPPILTTILVNLVQNGIKYGRGVTDHRVSIRAMDGNARVRFEVEDSGLGIPAELEKQIFNPYVRAPGRHEAGIGLGLATVKRLVIAHGGSVGVENRPGQGCTFWFELPSASA